MDDSSDRRIRRGRTIIWAAVAAAAVIGLAIGAAAGSVSSGHHARPAHIALWREVLGLCLIAVGSVVEVAVFVRLYRSRQIGGNRRSPLADLSRRDRLRALRQIYGRSPVSEDEVQWLRALAMQVARQAQSLVGVTAGTITILIGVAVTSRSAWTRLIVVFAAVVNVATALLSTGNSRRAAKFIREHPVGTARPQG